MKMNEYQAFMAAADFIEANPHRYCFTATLVPDKDYGDGCMWGWAAHFYGIKAGRSYREMAKKVFPKYTNCLSDPMFEVGKALRLSYTANVGDAALLMRTFANTQLAHLKPKEGLDPAYLRWRTGFLAWAKGVFSRRQTA